MFNHIMIGSNDIERSKRFYDAVQPLINNLRSDLRTQLGLEPIPTSLELPASGPSRTARANRNEGGGGGGMGGAAGAGGLGAGMIAADSMDSSPR
jgi:catechol 2,3-dioxygenase-like lactoylglutathione lyase family enzyme